MDISCAFAPERDTPRHIAEAEQLGYKRAWCYDSPALYADVWMTLALAAQTTSVIGLGPGVLVPHLRHVMTTAAAIGTLADLAPGRVVAGVGSGFTGRLALGRRPMPWARVREYVTTLKALLAGREAEWDGTVVKMLHLEGFAPPRPVEVPILVAIGGPKGLAVAEHVADGVLLTGGLGYVTTTRLEWVVQTAAGTVLDPDGSPDSERAMAAAGHVGALAYHVAYGAGRIDQMPRGEEYARAVDAIEPRRRHLAVHEGHLVAMNAIDQQVVTGQFLAEAGIAAEAGAWQARLEEMRSRGVTELTYHPAGPDIGRELRAFAKMAGLV
jgi:5,10-methylenetetrahydromethanopterin reductase